MESFRRLFAQLLPLLLVMALLAGNAGAALLDVGPTVPQVIDSTLPNLGHGYPSWYRDTNRLPLELCLNEAMCFFAPPAPLQAVSFPGNIPDELFFWAAVSSITLPGTNQKALLDMAIEAAYSTGNVVPGAQVTFARMRLRVDTPVAGQYIVTTPFKQLTFDVTDIAAGINFTQDIGIAEGGIFTGALAGSVGPFLYCTDAPFPATDGTGGLYIGKNATLCPVLGSTFIPPGETLPANYFRVQGPAAFGTVTGTDFSIQGKIRTGEIPTPLSVDKATYALDNTGMQVNAFATTQPMANPKGAGVFPLNFALNGTASILQLSGTGIPAQALMTTNGPADGKFFSASGLFTAPATLPPTVTVTNTSDIPPTVKTVPLVDEVVITKASYNPVNSTLLIVASSSDRVAAPALQAFIPGMTVPIGTLSNGQLNVSFPFTDNSVPQQPKTYNIPPSSVQVVSLIGGSATASVTVLVPPPPPVAVDDAAATLKGAAVTISVLANDTTAGSLDPSSVTIVTATTSGASAVPTANGTIIYTPLPAFTGTDTFTYTVRDTFNQLSNTATVTVTVHAPPVAVNDSVTAIVNSLVNINLIANDVAFSSSINSTTVNIVSAVSCGLTSVLPNGTVNFTAPANVPAGPGTCSFSYVVSDTFVPAALSNVATVTVTITPPPAPVAGDDVAATITGTPVIVNVIANDTSAVSTINPATVAVNAPTGGTVAANLDGTATYTPPATPGIYTFIYTVKDNAVPANISNAATVTVTVTPAPPIPPASAATLTTTLTSPQNPGANVIFVGQGQGGSGTYQYQFWFNNGIAWSLVQDYSSSAIWNWDTAGLTPGTYAVQMNVRSAGSTFLPYEASTSLNYVLTAPNAPASSAILVSSLTSPQLPGPTVTFVGSGQGGSGAYEYQYWLNNGATWNMVQDYSISNTWDWNTTGLAAGTYAVQINVRNAGSSALPYEAARNVIFVLGTPVPAATGAVLTALPASPMPGGTTSVTFTGAGFGGSGSYEYQFWFNNGTSWILLQDYSAVDAAAWNPATVPAGTYQFQVNVRSAGSKAQPYEAAQVITYVK